MSLTVTPDPGREEKGSRMTHAPDPADPTKSAPIWHGLVDAWIEGDGTQFPQPSASSRSVLRQIQTVLVINGIAVMTTPNEWSKGVVEGALAEPIERVLGDILQSPVTLSLSIRAAEPEGTPQPANTTTLPGAAARQAPTAPPPSRPPPSGKPSRRPQLSRPTPPPCRAQPNGRPPPPAPRPTRQHLPLRQLPRQQQSPQHIPSPLPPPNPQNRMSTPASSPPSAWPSNIRAPSSQNPTTRHSRRPRRRRPQPRTRTWATGTRTPC